MNDALSSALTWGIEREQAFARNWSQLVELPWVTPPKPIARTPERIEHWKRTGEKPGPAMARPSPLGDNSRQKRARPNASRMGTLTRFTDPLPS
ncbi:MULTISPECIES: hypothetical protein [Streptomyces]|uniref:Uncharacterized protein n=1 Tax=Streptomyces bottropensis ATCC 25435 TaxID=1054862 RepID=M3EHY7_9ACTN|nr:MULTISPECIES: hypothetical protein [Streptomyces]EMF55936.1 hypothetical protein SBD_3249 [Streptomyces bottropensis ATCC 25435]MZD16476.1 hypothetical protein [Streptomyces sp. SID5476]